MNINDNNFEQILKDNSLVMIDFKAQWCSPCTMISPIVNQLISEYKDMIIIDQVDVDDNPNIALKFGIRNIPALLFFKNGEIVDKQIGATTKSKLKEKLDKLLI